MNLRLSLTTLSVAGVLACGGGEGGAPSGTPSGSAAAKTAKSSAASAKSSSAPTTSSAATSSAATSSAAASSAAPAASASAAAPAATASLVPGFFQGEPAGDIKAWKGWVNTTYDFGFRIPKGWTSASLPGGGFMMHDADQKAIIALDYVGSAELSLANLQKTAKMAPFQATDLVEVEAPQFVDVGTKKFLAKGALAKGQLNKSPGQIFWMDLAGIQTHDGNTDNYHFIVMIGLKDGVSDESKATASDAIRAMTPMSGRPFWKR